MAAGGHIIAAHLFCAGAHDEILSDLMPELYGSWEAGIDRRLQDYAEEYRQPLLQRIAGTNWRTLLLSRDFSFDELYDKMRKTRFDLSADGMLVRRSGAGRG